MTVPRFSIRVQMESANARPRKLSLPAARARDSLRDIVLHHKPATLAILILTYAGIALGRVPGLQLNRTGIALLGAIGMMIFGGVTTAEVVSYINWPTIFLLFGFFVISAQLRLSGFYHLVAGGLSARLGHPAKFLFVLMAATAGFSSTTT
jgi:Na+/H+ antiporter NhaD/arsenite permease-like protein